MTWAIHDGQEASDRMGYSVFSGNGRSAKLAL